MVCLGAVLFAVVSLHCFGGVGDPGRVDAQVVTGIGFLGAGAIINQQGSVHGLTKAARLWFTEGHRVSSWGRHAAHVGDE